MLKELDGEIPLGNGKCKSQKSKLFSVILSVVEGSAWDNCKLYHKS